MLGDLGPLYSYMRRYRWQYVQGTLACVATNIVAVQFPRVLGMAVNRIQQGTTRELILIFALILVAISLVKGVFLYAQRWILIGISREIEFDLRNDLFRNLETQDSGFYQRYRTGDIMARMTNDLNAVRMLLGPALMYSANTIFLSVFALFFMLRISPYLTLVALAPMPLASILVQYLGRRIHERFERIQASTGELFRRAADKGLCPRGVADRALRAAQSAVHRPRAAAGAVDGHALADARVHSRHFDGHHAAGRRTRDSVGPH
jgi:ATP-binding cassette, subfamily B, multidrug efflux pump